MWRRQYLFIALLAVLLIGLVAWGKEVGFFAYKVFTNVPAASNAETLISENLALKAEFMKIKKEALMSIHFAYVSAFVYSRYPFNLKDTLTLSAGTRDGVTDGAAVVLPTDTAGAIGIFVGLITQASESVSEAQTVFDPSFKLPVRIGSFGAQALLVGGLVPRLTLIGKDAKIQEGDLVYSTASHMPYGIAVGYSGVAVVSQDQIFKEAPLVTTASFSDIETVRILIQQ